VVLVSAAVAVVGIVLVIRAFGGGSDTRPAGVGNGKIAIAREGCDGEVFMCREPAHIVLTNPDGRGERDIGEGSTPAWFPDGSRLAFTAGDGRAIYVVDADGTNRRAVVRCDDPDCVSVMSPTWSPDGSQLSFTSERPTASGRDPEVDIWVVNADGTDAHAVTACRPPDCSSNFAPAWSPVGEEIAMWSMVRCGDGWGPSLRLLDLSSGDIRNVVSCVGSNGSRIAWSPDGRFLAFELDTGDGTGNIFTIPATGGSSTQVTSCDRAVCRWAYYPSWSPDGRWILFAVKSAPEAPFEVARARPDGSEFQRVGIQGFLPAWQPVPVRDETPGDLLPSEIVPVVTATIPAGSVNSASILFAEGSVWVTDRDETDHDSSGLVVRIDAATNEVVAEIPVAAVAGWESGGAGMTYGLGSIWVTGSGELPDGTGGAIVSRIDPSSNEVVATIPLAGDGADVAVDETGLWVALLQGRSTAVARVDPATNEVSAMIPLESGWIGRVESVRGRILAFQLNPSVISVIDPATNAVVAEARDAWHPFSVAVSADALWTQTDAGITQVDPLTGEVAGGPVAVPLGAYGMGFAVGEGGIWFVGYNPNDDAEARPVTVNRFDPVTGRVDLTAEVPEAGGRAMVAGGGALWSLGVDGTLRRIDLVPAGELSRAEAIRPFVAPLVAAFLQARIDGAGAEAHLTREALEAWTSGASGLEGLYAPDGVRYASFHIELLDELGDGTYQVGVRIFGELEGDVLTESLFEETLLVGPGVDLNGATQPLLVTGARPGRDGA
jgi:DNA-binding beta-propeller fold protein YncE